MAMAWVDAECLNLYRLGSWVEAWDGVEGGRGNRY